MKKLFVILCMTAAACAAEVSDEVGLEEQELLLTPLTQKQGICSPHSGGTWCTTQSPVFEGAYYTGSTSYTDYTLRWYNLGPLPGAPADSGVECAIVRRVNDCNYLRACRYPASDSYTNPSTTGLYTISLKKNVGLAMANQCPGAQGLSVLRFGSMTKLPYSNTQQHSIRIIWPPAGQTLLQVQYDGYATPHTTNLPAGVQAWTGHASVYSEQGVFDVQMDGN